MDGAQTVVLKYLPMSIDTLKNKNENNSCQVQSFLLE